MIISDEQARIAAQYARTPCFGGTCTHTDISPELFDRVLAAVRQAPETRDERVREAIDYLGAGEPDSREVASKMISRIISDSLR